MEIRLAADSPTITLTHTLINDGLWTVELAPWAITQFNLGGMAILPMPIGNVDEAGLLPNRQFSFWPYTRLQDPRLNLRDDYILFKADAFPAFKMGYFNPHGWLAYYVNGILFRKTFSAHTEATHPDNNCNAELYCNDHFIELESLGPLTVLNPGSSVTHQEIWEVTTSLDALPKDAQQLLASTIVK
jgi:hypothetical protein